MIFITLAVGPVLLALGAIAWRLRTGSRSLRVPQHRDDTCRCLASHVEVSVNLDARGLDLPANLSLTGCTVLLRMVVKASPLGYLLDPFVEFTDGRRRFRQYFERGLSGQRYLNLSALFAGHGQSARVRMRGSGLGWKATAALLAFDPPRLDNAAILVLAPHPDDAEIAAFGVYAHSKAWVATITAGERGTGLLPADIPASERSYKAAELRVNDSLTVPQIGEIPPERRVNLVCPDGALQSMFREPSRAFALACESQLPREQLRARNPVPEFQQGGTGCTWDALVDDLCRLLEHSQPDIIVCPHPGDSHPDHVFTTVALDRALSRSGGKRPLLLLYAVHHAAGPRHPFGPTDAVVGLPPGIDATWAVDAVYSLELGTRRLQEKRQALESMFATRWPGLFRRAWRPNELYYVLRGEQLSAAIGALGGEPRSQVAVE